MDNTGLEHTSSFRRMCESGFLMPPSGACKHFYGVQKILLPSTLIDLHRKQVFLGALLLSARREGESGAAAGTLGPEQVETCPLANTGVPHLTLCATMTSMTDPAEISSRGYGGMGLWFVNGLCLHGATWIPTAPTNMAEDPGMKFGASGQFVQRPVNADLPIIALGECTMESVRMGSCVPIYHSRRKGASLVAALDFYKYGDDCSWAKAASILLED